ncbi:MAG: hypothetical protein PHG83_00090 [Patescibacteria group bacterium]|nr:hypothetical protein [Patescibacteria group bacterium]
MNIQVITNWANQNQGLLAIILFSASFIICWISGFFKWIFGKFRKSDASFSVGNKTFIQKSGKNSQNIQGKNITLNKYGDDK